MKLTIEVRERDGRIVTEEVNATPSSTAGLVVHHDSGHNGPLETWAVTHEDSGLKILGQFKTRRAALQFAARIGPLADWTKPKAVLLAKQKEIMPAMNRVRDAFQSDRKLW